MDYIWDPLTRSDPIFQIEVSIIDCHLYHALMILSKIYLKLLKFLVKNIIHVV